MTQDYKEDKVAFHLNTNNALDRVTELVHHRLVDCGWREQVRLACRNAITENGDKVPSIDDLILSITSTARSMVPDAVKKELLHELETILVNADKAAH